MQITTILSPGRTWCNAPGASKKKVLENIATLISKDINTLSPNQLFDSLIAREKLGSTGLGHGIAIPHCRIKNCDRIIGSLIKLEKAVDFDAIDNQPVDLLFVLLVPDQAHDEHLKVLAKLAELFNSEEFCKSLRQASDNQSLYTVAVNQ